MARSLFGQGPRGGGVRIFDTALDAMFLPGGMCHEWTRDRVRQATALAVGLAPVRSGRLKSGIRTDSEFRPGRRKSGFFIRSDAPYTQYVHEGTYGPIVAKNGAQLWVPKYPHSDKPRQWRDSVRGQAAQPFLANALEVVFSAYTVPSHDFKGIAIGSRNFSLLNPEGYGV